MGGRWGRGVTIKAQLIPTCLGTCPTRQPPQLIDTIATNPTYSGLSTG